MKTQKTSLKIVAAIIGLAFLPFAAQAGSCASCGTHKHADDIVGVAVEAGSFNTLAAALTAAGLVDTLQGDGPFTVFAPTDEAFAKLPAGTVESLLKPENKQALIDILTYHVVAGEVTSDQVVKLDSATTVEGSDVAIKVKDGSVFVDNAQVVKTDISASNGVIHVIDSVILPNS
ncbi:MAG: fasciclin domain-containing protein [Puniceicoccaceae bacterium]